MYYALSFVLVEHSLCYELIFVLVMCVYIWDKKKEKQEISFKWYIKEKAIFPCYKKMHVTSKRKVAYFIFQGETIEKTKRNNFEI